MENYVKQVDKLLNNILNAPNENERVGAIQKLHDFTKRSHGADFEWYYNKFIPETSDEEITNIVECNKQMAYPSEDVYFRKANFVYAFFKPYLVDERCIVTKDMVNELLDKCKQVLDAAHKDGLVDSKGKISKHLINSDNTINIEEFNMMPTEWINIASSILPTQDGFFFGNTDYNLIYLWDVKSCVNQFSKLLRTWKDDEIVYNVMSW